VTATRPLALTTYPQISRFQYFFSSYKCVPSGMNRPSTPPTSTNSIDHLPPSQSNSPLAKRTKMSPSTTNDTNASPSNPSVPRVSSTSQPPLLIRKLSPKATMPTRGSSFAAGYDLYSAHDTVVPARGKVLVDTELAIAVPEGTCKTGPFLKGDLQGGRRVANGLLTFASRWTNSPPLRSCVKALHRYWGRGH
jgi:dUTPase